MAGITVSELVSKWGFQLDQNSFNRVNSGISGLSRKIFSLKTALVTLGAGLLGSVFVKTAGDMEQWTIAFETMLGSADKARNLMGDITSFAKKTPFELTSLVENSKKLLAYGIEDTRLIDHLETLGNIAAGVGKDKLPQLILALGQVRAAEKLRGQEVRQFTEAGVPIYEQLSKVLNKPVKEIQGLVSAGKVSYEQTYTALRQLSEPGGRFANLMIKQSKTLFGVFSNIKDTVTIIAGRIGAQMLPYIKAAANALLNFLGGNEQRIISGAVEIIKVAVQVFQDFYWVGKMVAPVIGNVIEKFGGLSQVIKGFAVALASPLLIFDDLAQYFQGNDSLFGRLINVLMKNLPIVINRLVEFLRPVEGILRSLGEQLNFIWRMILKIIDLLKKPKADFVSALASVWGMNLNFMKQDGLGGKGVGALRNWLSSSSMIQALNATGAGQADFLRWMDPRMSPAISGGGAMGIGAPGNYGMSVGDIVVNVNGAGNAAETGAAVGSAVKDSLDKVLRQAKRDLRKTVVR